MKDLREQLFAVVESIYWADTRSRMVIALGEALPALEAIDEAAFLEERDKKAFRYIREVAREYSGLALDYSSDIRNEVRDALAMLLALCRRVT